MSRVDTAALKNAVLATIKVASICAKSKSISVGRILDHDVVKLELGRLPAKKMGMSQAESDLSYVRSALQSLIKAGEIRNNGGWTVAP